MACAGEFRFFGQQPVPMHDVWRMASMFALLESQCFRRGMRWPRPAPGGELRDMGCDVVSFTTKTRRYGKIRARWAD